MTTELEKRWHRGGGAPQTAPSLWDPEYMVPWTAVWTPCPVRHLCRFRRFSTAHGMRLGSRVVSVLDSGAEGPGFNIKSQPRRRRVTVLGKLFTPIVPLFTKQRNW